MITITERAASELKALMTAENKLTAYLRVWVAGGGCSGLSYGMALDDGEPETGDQIFENEGVKVLVDDLSLRYMTGSVVDYIEDSLGGGFSISNPLAVKSCGCGSSFQTEESADGVPAASGGGCGGCGFRG